ncbi:hypothetical protein [Lentzea sp. E54]|uniref:hypothetical protein n=1 Tax=Lentzea xerophila TaxID=3435883 RepID=UPI003DA5BB6A
MVEDDGDSEDERWDTLEFNRDGERVSFTVRHNEYAHYDHETAGEIIDLTVHKDDPRLWQDFQGSPDLIGQLFVLFTPDQAEGFNQRIAPLINCRRPVTPPAP